MVVVLSKKAELIIKYLVKAITEENQKESEKLRSNSPQTGCFLKAYMQDLHRFRLQNRSKIKREYDAKKRKRFSWKKIAHKFKKWIEGKLF